VALAAHDHVVQTLATDGSDQALGIRILPWAGWTRDNFSDTHGDTGGMDPHNASKSPIALFESLAAHALRGSQRSTSGLCERRDELRVDDLLSEKIRRRGYDGRMPDIGPLRVVAVVAVASLFDARPALAQSDASVLLTVPSGRALRVALAENTTVHRIGQVVTAQLVEPVYAYDRVVLPVGTLVHGRITKLTQPSKFSRFRSMTSGDFSPHRAIEIRFDSVMRDGSPMSIDTIAMNETPHPKRAVAPTTQDTEDKGKVARAKAEAKSRVSAAVTDAKQRAADAINAVKAPGRLERVKQWAVDQLPYRPQVLRKGTAYDAELVSSVDLGRAVPTPDAVLKARLLTTIDSRATPRGSALAAIVSTPVFAEDGRLIFPEGTKLIGEVTFATPARRFHRNGQLRFLFAQVELPTAGVAPMLASLHAADVSGDDAITLDDEGGAAVKNSKTRFVEPAIALLALRGAFDHGEGGGFDGGATGGAVRTTSVSARGGGLARGVGGLIGFGAIGFVVGRLSPPVGVALGFAGAARSVYTNVVGKGQEVHFAADTPIEVQLGPGPTSR
jgi:hypothetical protein